MQQIAAKFHKSPFSLKTGQKINNEQTICFLIVFVLYLIKLNIEKDMIMKATQLGKIKKGDFENTLYLFNHKRVMDYAKHQEFNFDTNKNTIIHCYYNDNGHIGSWSNGEGWYFQDNLPLLEEGENNE